MNPNTVTCTFIQNSKGSSFFRLALFRISNFAIIFEVGFISHIKFCELLFIIIPNRPFSEGFKIVKPFPNQLELGQNHRTHYSLHVPPLKQFEQGLSSLTHIHRTITATVYSFVKEELRLQEHGQTVIPIYPNKTYIC